MPCNLANRRLYFYQGLCNLTLCVILAELAFTLVIGLKPVDVTGTFMGGGYGQLQMLVIWCSVMLGLVLCSLARLPRHWEAWALAGVVQMTVGLWWRVDYPSNEQLIYLPSSSYIAGAAWLGLAMSVIGVRRSRRPRKPLDVDVMAFKSVAALILLIIYVGIPMAIILPDPLPPCSFDKAGKQLTICIE